MKENKELELLELQIELQLKHIAVEEEKLRKIKSELEIAVKKWRLLTLKHKK